MHILQFCAQCQIYDDEKGCCSCWYDFEEKHLETDNEGKCIIHVKFIMIDME